MLIWHGIYIFYSWYFCILLTTIYFYEKTLLFGLFLWIIISIRTRIEVNISWWWPWYMSHGNWHHRQQISRSTSRSTVWLVLRYMDEKISGNRAFFIKLSALIAFTAFYRRIEWLWCDIELPSVSRSKLPISLIRFTQRIVLQGNHAIVSDGCLLTATKNLRCGTVERAGMSVHKWR